MWLPNIAIAKMVVRMMLEILNAIYPFRLFLIDETSESINKTGWTGIQEINTDIFESLLTK